VERYRYVGSRAASGKVSQVKVSQLAYVRLQVPDLDKQTEFLTNFGLVSTQRVGGKQYLRPTDPVPYCYVVAEGPQGFLGGS